MIIRRVNFKVVIASVVILLVIILFFFKTNQKNKIIDNHAIPIKISNVKIDDVPLKLTTVGNVVTINSVTINSRLTSQIMAIKFHDGDYIKKDQLLFILDERELKAQLNQLQSNLAGNLAQLKNLRIQYERIKKLAAQGFDTVANLDDAKAAYEMQIATINAVKATIDDIKTQITYAIIRSPISGRAGTITITNGNNVKANDVPLVTINQISPIRIQVSLPQKYLQITREAITSGIIVQALVNDNYSLGKLEYIDNNVDTSTNTFVARALFDNKDEKLWPGMFVNIEIILGKEKQVITIPEVAVQHGQDGDYVFAVKDNKALKQNIKISRIQDGIAVVEEGLTAEDKVAIDGLMLLKDGSLVSYPNAQR